MPKEVGVAFLESSGLLFEINRNVLHPYGYSLLLKDDRLVLEDHTGETGGLAFSVEEMNVGLERLARFFQEKKVINRLGERVKLLGGVVQGAERGHRRDQKNDR